MKKLKNHISLQLKKKVKYIEEYLDKTTSRHPRFFCGKRGKKTKKRCGKETKPIEDYNIFNYTLYVLYSFLFYKKLFISSDNQC